ncbi:recombination mediator RecR [Ferroacidibacillus organovorans]|uniref:Recombination protein RecR n=1 Tax=Ferroacidibacillus organovorans TaxID=1765683 RepID=A0A168C3U7_9BACL|nr:recombination mediator RecR [Ferroacidibacillus organovorans]KYP81517.1 recombination protein RecR [Ferroacidibacillus organovorans]OAG94049.1 recombination protein RecR [Ferroacidibacillus organovorans]OPG16873.1 recombination protein RecR [Ferroacidibacillus organovorans]
MYSFPPALANLIEQLSSLPGIGPKSAQRLAFHLVAESQERIEQLVETMVQAKEKLHTCRECFALCDGERCDVCADAERDQGTLCVVQDTRDVFALERMNAYRGLYHVLGGAISPLDGVGPDQLHLRPLLERLKHAAIHEVILATSTTMEGEATAHYLAKLMRGVEDLRVTRIAHGIPIGGDLEYADDLTLARALEYRHEMA